VPCSGVQPKTGGAPSRCMRATSEQRVTGDGDGRRSLSTRREAARPSQGQEAHVREVLEQGQAEGRVAGVEQRQGFGSAAECLFG